jgi:hypothetical protein
MPAGIGKSRNKGEGMIWQHVRVALLAGSIVAATAWTARAEDAPQPAGPAPVAADPCAPQYRTVCVKEWVPENYTTTRTVYTRECKTETYTAYRCECVPETKTRTVTCYKMVPETRVETRKVCEMVPTVEERTVMQTHVVCKPVTEVVRKCVDRGHYECREVPCGPSLLDRLKGCFHRHDDCCEPCPPCPRTKTVRVWVPCPVWEEKTVCRMQRVCESRPVVCKVTVCKPVWKEIQCNVTVCKCVPETKTETYTCMTTRQVPYQATRTVTVCVPHQETVTCCRMVCRTVEKQVPVTECCETTTCCKRGLFHGLHFRRHHDDCCD